MEQEYINILLDYIKAHYEDRAIIQPYFESKFNIYIESEQYDLNISVEKTEKDCYLFGKAEYFIDFRYDANKKYRKLLCYRGGGHIEEFNINDFSNIDKFLKEFCKKKEYEQMFMRL